MGQVVLTTASTSPWAVPAIFQVAGHTATLVGSGGNGGLGTSGATGTAGGGGGGGSCTVCTYSSGTVNPGSTTIAFLINAGNSANATQWQSSSAGTGAFYEGQSGGTGAATGTAGAAGGSTTTVGTPTITYTVVNHTGAAGGAGGGANTLGAGGGGGSGGLAANGGVGGTPTSTGGGGGGGGGAANAGGSPSTATGGTGGNGSSGAGGTGSGTSGTSGNPGTGSSGGGGGPGAATVNVAGNGGSGSDFGVGTGAVGCGGGGGGTGSKITTGAATTITGGTGGNFGGGGGGVGCQRTAGGTLTVGPGAAGVIVVTFTSIGIDWDVNSRNPAPLYTSPRTRNRYAGAKGKSEFAFPTGWQNAGWEPTRSQEPRRKWEHVAAVMPRDDGIENFYTQWRNDGWEQTNSQEPRRKWERTAAVMPKDDGSELPLINWFNRFEQTFSQEPRRRWERSAGIRGKSGFAFYQPWVNLGWEPNITQPPHRIWKSPDIGDGGIEAVFVPPVAAAAPSWGFDIQQQPTYPNWKRAGAIGRDWYDNVHAPFSQWQNWFDQTYSQPPHRIWKSPDIGDSGIEAPLINWFNFGWEVQPPPPPHTWRRGQGLRGDDGTEAPFVPWINIFDQTFSQPPRRYWERSAATMRGPDGTESPFQQWLNDGWAQIYSQPLHKIWKLPDIGDSGIEALLINWFNWSWEQTQSQPIHRFLKSPDIGDSGIEAVFTTVAPGFVFWPFDPTFSQEPRRRWEKTAAIMRGDDGTEAPLINWFNQGWPIQYGDVRHPRYTGGILRGDDGTESPYVFWQNFGFEQAASQPLHRFWKSPDIGDGGIEFPFVPPPAVLPTGWGWEIPWHPSRRYWEHSGAIRGKSGFAFYQPWVNLGWEQAHSQPPHKIWKSPDIGDGGTEAPFIFVPPVTGFVPWGFEVQPPMLIRPRLTFSALAGRSIIGFTPPTPWGYESFFQPPHPRPERSAAFLRGDEGNQLPQINWFNWGWGVQPPQPPYRWYRGQGLRGDDGTENIFVQWFNWWEQTYTQPPHRIWKSPTTGDTGTEAAFINWFNYGWEPTRSQEPRRKWERLAALLRGPDGTDLPLINWFNWGWEPNVTQPPHRIWKSPTTGDTGNERTQINWFNFGWEIQPPQPPRWPQTRRGAIMPIEQGIVSPFVFVPSTGANWGWMVEPWQPPHRWYRGQGFRGDDGTEYTFSRWFLSGWEVQPPQPPRWPQTRRGAVMPIEQGVEAPYKYVQFVQQLGEVNLPMLRHPRPERGAAILIGDTGLYFPFIPTPPFVPGLRPRNLTGKVFIIDAVPSMDRPLYFFGPNPRVNESCTLVFYVGGGLPITPAPVLFTFTRPDSVIQLGDVPFSFIGTPTVTQTLIPSFQSRQYLVYQFGIGELSQAGTWLVSAGTTNFISNTYSFTVLP